MAAHLSNDEKLNLISNLYTMLNAGISVLEAVDSLLIDSKDNTRKILEHLKKELNEGQTIADSLTSFGGDIFDPVTINLIKASEESGTLDQTLKDLTTSIKKDMEFNGQIKNAMIYPVFVLVVFVGVIILMLTVVIPKISVVFSRLRVNLPLPTKILLATSNFMTGQLVYFILIIVLVGAIIIYLYKTKRKALFNALSSLPLFSSLARDIDMNHFCRSMALLLNSGIPITEALELTEKMLTKKAMIKMIQEAKANVAAGKELSESFHKNKKLVSPLVVRIINAGEKSGTLEKVMQDLADYFDLQVSKKLNLLTTLLEPVMIVIIGILVGGLMVAIIAPIYGLIGQIQ